MDFLARFDTLHDLAARETGLDDFGPDDYHAPLRLLLADYDTYGQFTPLGLQMTEGNLVALLASRLRTQQGFARYPHLRDTPIERPIVIVGTMRSGSTALHRLLASDPECQWLPPWLGTAPMPRPRREAWDGHASFQRTAQGFEQLYAVAPGFREMHPMAADLPDECRFANDHSFWSPGLGLLASAPNYAMWVREGDARYAYRRHRQVLGLISGGDKRQWVLKDPCHLWAFDALLDEFPDACVVWTHREPVGAMVSAASIFLTVRGAIEALPRERIGREEMELWAAALAKSERVRRQHDPARFLDVHMHELRRDPLAVAERVHRHFGLPTSDRQRACWAAYVAQRPDAGHVASHLTPADLGFGVDDVRRAIGDYAETYARIENSRASGASGA